MDWIKWVQQRVKLTDWQKRVLGTYFLMGTLVGLVVFLPFLAFWHEPQVLGGITNDDWNGSSMLRESLSHGFVIERSLVSPTSSLDTPPSMFVLIGAEVKYSSEEVLAIEDYVSNGGHLVVFEDFGHGGQILSAFGLTLMSGHLLESVNTSYDTRPGNLVLTEVPALSTGEQLLLSDAAAILVTTPVTVESFPFAWTTETTFLDTNHNGEIDSREVMTNYPVGWLKQHGDGVVLAFTDVSMILNEYARIPEYSNLKLVLGMMLLIHTQYTNQSIVPPERSEVVMFDETHKETLPFGPEGWYQTVSTLWIAIGRSRLTIAGLGVVLSISIYRWVRRSSMRELFRRSVLFIRGLERDEGSRIETIAETITSQLAAHRASYKGQFLHSYLRGELTLARQRGIELGDLGALLDRIDQGEMQLLPTKELLSYVDRLNKIYERSY